MPTSGSALRCASVRIGLSGDAVSQLATSPPITVKQGAVLSLAYAQPQEFSLLQPYGGRVKFQLVGLTFVL